MRQIDIKQISIEGFKSFKKKTVIDFSDEAGLRFLCGRNDEVPRLGANGAGKSALFDAIFWCLYGASIRDSRSSVILSHGSETIDITLNMIVDHAPLEVRRTFPPNKLYINGKIQEQDKLLEWIYLSKGRFKHSIIFGQGVPLFYDLSSPERGVLLDEILDLQVWLKRSEAAGKRSKELEIDISQRQHRIEFLRGKLEGLPALTDIQTQLDAWSSKQQEAIDAAQREVQEREETLKEKTETLEIGQSLREVLERQLQKLPDITAVEAELSKCQLQYQRMHDRIDILKSDERFYKAHKNCPTCKQAITEQFTQSKIEDINTEIDSIDLTLVSERVSTQIGLRERVRADRHGIEVELMNVREDLIKIQTEIRTIEQGLLPLRRSIDKLKAETNPWESSLQSVILQRKELQSDLDIIQAEVNKLVADQHRVDYWRDGFKQIRLDQVKQTLDFIAIAAANTASAFGLSDWKIELSTELETKSGTVRPGIHITVSDGVSSNPREFSPGEEQRIRLAISLGFADVIQQMSGTNWSLQVLDEPSNWLAAEGIEDLLSLLAYIAIDREKQIWVIDHHGLQSSGFTEIWQAIKDDNGTRINKI